jgi:hypothetical protein
MKFKILSSEETEICDPDTGERLGLIEREKTRVEVIHVQERLSICRTYKTITIGGGPLYWSTMATLGEILRSPPQKKPETLKASESDYLPPLSEEESFVKKGDRVVQLLND